jgi:hypothetical protein
MQSFRDEIHKVVDRETGELYELEDCPGCAALNKERTRDAQRITALQRELADKRARDSRAGEVAEVLGYWQQRTGHTKAYIDSTTDRYKNCLARLKQGYTVEQLKQAIDGAVAGGYVDPKGVKHDDAELIFRKADKTDRFIRLSDAKPRAAASKGSVRVLRGAHPVVNVLVQLGLLEELRATCPACGQQMKVEMRSGRTHCFGQCTQNEVLSALTAVAERKTVREAA